MSETLRLLSSILVAPAVLMLVINVLRLEISALLKLLQSALLTVTLTAELSAWKRCKPCLAITLACVKVIGFVAVPMEGVSNTCEPTKALLDASMANASASK